MEVKLLQGTTDDYKPGYHHLDSNGFLFSGKRSRDGTYDIICNRDTSEGFVGDDSRDVAHHQICLIDSSGRQRGPSPEQQHTGAIYAAFLLAGTSFLLPVNSFILASDYYMTRFPQSTIMYDISLVYILLAFLTVTLNNTLVNRVGFQARIIFGHVLSLTVLTTVAVVEMGFELLPPHFSYTFVLLAVGLVSVGSTVQQSSFYGYTSMLPRRYVHAVMTGESLAGVLLSLGRILTKALLPHRLRDSTLVFMLLVLAVQLAALLAFRLTRRSRLVQHFLSMVQLCKSSTTSSVTFSAHSEEVEINADALGRVASHLSSESNPLTTSVTTTDSLGSDGCGTVLANRHLLQQHGKPAPTARLKLGGSAVSPTSCESTDSTFNDYNHHLDNQLEQINIDEDDEDDDSLRRIPIENLAGFEEEAILYTDDIRAKAKRLSDVKDGISLRLYLARRLWPFLVSIGLTYLVTLSLFPGIESDIPSSTLHVGSWMPVILMGVFNLSDLMGKILSGCKRHPHAPTLVTLSMVRFLLIPVMLLTALPVEEPVLAHETWSIGLSAILGVTNGYLGSLPMIAAPGQVDEIHRELTGNLMTVSYNTGLTVGSLLSYLLRVIVRQSSLAAAAAAGGGGTGGQATTAAAGLNLVQQLFNNSTTTTTNTTARTF